MDNKATRPSLSRRGRRSFLDLISELDDPKARVDVVKIDQAVVRLRAPGEGQIGAITFDVTGPDSTNLAALSIQVAASFAGDIDDTAAATVVAHVHDSVFDPNVVRVTFGNGILGEAVGFSLCERATSFGRAANCANACLNSNPWWPMIMFRAERKHLIHRRK